MSKKPSVVFGFLGTRLDGGYRARRWERWRPTIDLCLQPELRVTRLELFAEASHDDLAERVRADLREVAPQIEVRVHQLGVEDPWDFEEVYTRLFGFVRSYPFQPSREDYRVHMTTGTHVAQIVWFLLCEARHLPGQLLQTAPPIPSRARRGERIGLGSISLIDLDLARYERIAARFAEDQLDARSFLKAGIQTRNVAFNALIAELEAVAAVSRDPILLTGPTGAGKSHLARRVYQLKRQRGLVDGELVEVNCATLRGDAAMSALFGHVRGAFTGAVQAREGLLRRADRGVLFLDEVGELGLDEQAMLLRAVEERRFLPVGADREVESQFQLLAGTNRDLQAAVRAGTFREDLMARIDLWTFELPALADRPEDLEPNLDYELEKASEALDRRIALTRPARQAYLEMGRTARWARNFRDLNSSVRRMATLSQGGRITLADVRREEERLDVSSNPREEGGERALERGLEAHLGAAAAAELDPFDAVQLAYVLEVVADSPSLSAAGRVLFAQSRERRRSRNDADRLRKYLARFGLEAGEIRAGGRPRV
ncbi:MAG: sigma 54-interacting transcriptional regulator [Planctomycetes bacterium]|nr:sigma 54-interacting transcriptional regulator [Planctomycetota bacterium]